MRILLVDWHTRVYRLIKQNDTRSATSIFIISLLNVFFVCRCYCTVMHSPFVVDGFLLIGFFMNESREYCAKLNDDDYAAAGGGDDREPGEQG